MKDIPIVSIGMPVYNGAKYICEAIDSLLAQTFTNFELIISDNASVDNTENICKKYAAIDKRIRYVRQVENIGAIANFQYVLDAAIGTYFMWAAHDDRRENNFLELTVKVFINDPSCGLVFCDYIVLNLDNGNSYPITVGMFNSVSASKRYLMRLLDPCPSIIYGLHKKELLLQTDLSNFDFCDVHITHWYALNSIVKIIPLPLYIAGIKGQLTVKGERIPYPANKSKGITATLFFKKEWCMLYSQFNLFKATMMYVFLRILYWKGIKQLRIMMNE